MKYILLEVPDTFPKCEGCPFYITLCDRDYCPLAKSREAVEVKDICAVCEDIGEGKPVKLFAVEDK